MIIKFYVLVNHTGMTYVKTNYVFLDVVGGDYCHG